MMGFSSANRERVYVESDPVSDQPVLAFMVAKYNEILTP